jgi:hypothetical protein
VKVTAAIAALGGEGTSDIYTSNAMMGMGVEGRGGIKLTFISMLQLSSPIAVSSCCLRFRYSHHQHSAMYTPVGAPSNADAH